MTTDALESQHALALRPGALLADRFRLVRSIRGASSFAFSYHAEDLTTGETVVVKEFFPRSLVSRGADGAAVRAHSPECERDFLRALHRFALEGAVLAESTHPNLVRVRAVIDANATVYLVMDRHDAQPLADYVRSAGGRIASSQAGQVVQQLLAALQVLHADSIIHRDLSPRSVHIDADGSALLLEFSARRHLPVHATDLATGFASFEQYGMREIGPWTDVYAVSALLYYMLTGAAPPSALERAAGEALVSPLTLVPGVAPGLARLAVKGMALLPQQRPHAVSELRRLLETAMMDAAPASARNTPTAIAPDEMASSAEDTNYDRGASLRLAAGGIVVPGEERGIRLLRKLGSAATLLRRTISSNGTPSVAPIGDTEAELRYARPSAHEAEPAPIGVAERPTPIVATTSFVAPAAEATQAPPARIDAQMPREFDLAAELALASDEMARFDRDTTRRRYSVAAAAVLVLVVGGSLVLLARNSRASDIKLPEGTVAARPAAVAAPASAPTAPESHVSVDGGAVLQSAPHLGTTTARPEPDSPAQTKRAPAPTHTSTPAQQNTPVLPRDAVLPSGRLPNVKIALAGTTADLKIMPLELLVDPRTRLSNGDDQIEQGEYVTARRTFRTAMQQLDSAAARYPESQAVKSLKHDLEQADARAAQACAAENEMRKRRGEQARACQ